VSLQDNRAGSIGDVSCHSAIGSNRPEVPAVAIIIPTLNRPQYALDTVRQVLEQSFRDFELLVIDQSGLFAAEELKARLASLNDQRVHYVHLPVSGVANARNEGIARRRGQIILFLDDDVILLGRNFIVSHLQALADPQVGGVTGRIVERLNRSNVRRTSARISIGGRTLDNMSGVKPVPVHGLKGGNMSLKAQIFDQLGGFDRNFGGTGLLEEADFSTRVRAAGWKLVFEPQAELFHFSAPTGGNRVESDLQREWWRFRATAYYIRKHRGILGLPPFLLSFTLIGLRCAWRERTPSALVYLVSGIRAGLLAYRNGPNQQLPRYSAEDETGGAHTR
jgi:GT2 family glycosyltransferase